MSFIVLLVAFAALLLAAFAIIEKFRPAAMQRVRFWRVRSGIRTRKTSTGLGVLLGDGFMVDGHVPMFANAAAVTVESLTEKLGELHAKAQGIQTAADADKRDLSTEETAEIAALMGSFDATEAEIERRSKINAMNERLAKPQRKTTADKPADDDLPPEQRQPRVTGGNAVGATKGTGGFRTLGDFAQAVHAALVGRKVDGRLYAAAPSTFSNEGSGADGGYLVPPDFRTSILQKVFGEDQLLPRTDQQTTTSNSITMPVDETTPWQTTGGIQAFWEGEASAYLQSKAALQAVSVRAFKLGALVPVTDEQLEDGPSLEAYLRRKTPDKINYKINDAILNGDGVGKPMGILKSGALVTQAAEAGQAPATIVFGNVTKMWSRMYAPSRRNAIWLANQDVEPQLQAMVVPGGSPAFPAYMPPGGLSTSMFGTLYNRPIVFTEAANALGAVGDLVLWDPTQYLTVVKSGGIRSDVSIHLWFDQGLTAFRFNIRLGGMPWWSAPIVRAKSANTLSCIVALAAR